MSLPIEALDTVHIREKFSCEAESLTRYLQQQASQDMRKNLAVCFVAVNPQAEVMGYYTLSSYSLKPVELPLEMQKKLPHYPQIPVYLLGRLARDVSQKGSGLGEFLLMDALDRAYRISKTQAGALAVVVDPLHDKAERFYAKYGFIKLPENGKMFLPMSVLRKLFGAL